MSAEQEKHNPNPARLCHSTDKAKARIWRIGTPDSPEHREHRQDPAQTGRALTHGVFDSEDECLVAGALCDAVLVVHVVLDEDVVLEVDVAYVLTLRPLTQGL